MNKSSKDLLWIVIGVILLFVLANRCSKMKRERYKKTPVEELMVSLHEVPNYSIMLYDMDFEEGLTSNVFKHRYQVVTNINDSIETDVTDWKEVTESFFEKHEKDLGMEIASKKDGKIKREVAPAGFREYVGNERYGHWQQRSDGSRFWEFYGKYAMLSSVFHMMRPTPYSHWYDYDRHYRSYGRPYYGGGSHSYGSYGNTQRNRNKSWNSTKSSGFKNRVQRRVSRSSRSSSRYNSSSFRSRGGGFGK